MTYYEPPVTARAVLRYLTRIDNFDLRPIISKLGRRSGNWPLAIAAAEALGVTVIDIQKRICPQHLASAVTGGAARIRRDGFILVCNEGRVVTIKEEQRHRSAKIFSNRELRKARQSRDRRAR